MWSGISLIPVVGVLAVLLSRQKWQYLCVRFDWRWLAGAAFLSFLYWSVRVARWRWMTALEGLRIDRSSAWCSMLAGLGAGLITPMRIGEVVRPIFVPKGARLRLVGSVVIERMFDLSGVLTLGVLGVIYMVFSGLLLTTGRRVPVWLLLVAPLLLAVALSVPLLVHYRPRGLWRIAGRILPGRAKQLAETRLSWRQFGIFYTVSLVAEAVGILAVFFCLRAFGPISIITATTLAPVVVLTNLLPAGPGGLGIREGTAALVIGAFGFSQEMVLAGYLSNTLIMLVIPGAAGVAAAWIAGVMKTGRPERSEA